MRSSVIDFLKRSVSSALYPHRCISCGRLVAESGVCSGCNALMPHLPLETCAKCGQIPAECECWISKPRLDGVAAPYYNLGRAQKSLYKFKFAAVRGGGEFFSKRMAERFRERFPEAEIDAVCCVPDAHNSGKRGYYTARELGERVARELGCPFYPKLIIQVKPSLPQHSLDYKGRIRNVKGIYKADDKARGKAVLVIDDIKTSGATLNECGRCLKKVKAKRVYGLSAVMSRNLQYF